MFIMENLIKYSALGSFVIVLLINLGFFIENIVRKAIDGTFVFDINDYIGLLY